jgi:Large polyvalent protein associated domain 29
MDLDKIVRSRYSTGMFGAQPKGDQPMPPSTKRYLSAAETAVLVRKALKSAHPGIKFSVRSRTYAGGASVNIGWTDGPTDPQVQQTARLFAGATFDGMTDMKGYHDSLLSTEDGAEVVHFGADFVQTHRTLSDEFRAELENEIAEFTGEPYDHSKAYHAAALGSTIDEPATLCVDHHCTTWGLDLLNRLAQNRLVPVAGERR